MICTSRLAPKAITPNQYRYISQRNTCCNEIAGDEEEDCTCDCEETAGGVACCCGVTVFTGCNCCSVNGLKIFAGSSVFLNDHCCGTGINGNVKEMSKQVTSIYLFTR